MASDCLMRMGLLLEWEKCLVTGWKWWLQNTVNLLNVTEFVHFKVTNFMLCELHLNKIKIWNKFLKASLEAENAAVGPQAWKYAECIFISLIERDSRANKAPIYWFFYRVKSLFSTFHLIIFSESLNNDTAECEFYLVDRDLCVCVYVCVC